MDKSLNDIVYVKECADENAVQNVNEYLAKGWKLLNVGTKLVGTTSETNQAIYMPCYVLGANQKQYDDEIKELNEAPKEIEDVLSQQDNSF